MACPPDDVVHIYVVHKTRKLKATCIQEGYQRLSDGKLILGNKCVGLVEGFGVKHQAIVKLLLLANVVFAFPNVWGDHKRGPNIGPSLLKGGFHKYYFYIILYWPTAFKDDMIWLPYLSPYIYFISRLHWCSSVPLLYCNLTFIAGTPLRRLGSHWSLTELACTLHGKPLSCSPVKPWIAGTGCIPQRMAEWLSGCVQV